MDRDLAHAEKRLKASSIRKFAMAFCIGINIAIIVLSVGGSYLAYRFSHLQTIGTSRSDILSQIASRVRDFKSNAYTISNLYWNDETFNDMAQSLDEDSAGAFSTYLDELTRQYKISFNQVNLDYYIVYLSINGIGYCSDEAPADYDFMNPKIRIWYKALYDAKGAIVDVASYKDKALGRNSFVAARAVLAPDDSILGYLMINVNERQIFNTYSDVIAPKSNIYIADEQGNIISSNVNNIVGFHYFNMDNLDAMFGNQVYTIIKLPYTDAMFTKYRDVGYRFTVFEETPLDEILHPIVATRNVVIAIACLVALLGVALAWSFAGKITRPILRLRDKVLLVESGDLNTEFPLNSYSEINTLSLGLGQMLSRIRELMESEKRKEEQKRKMQYHLLQAQINPHFMYNTLFSIKCMVDMRENDRATDMLSAFIHLLRSTLANPDSMSTVREQVETLRQYSDLQKFRYGACFDIVIEYEDTVADCLLPQLLVQPLVENAILHGMMGQKKEGGMIAVSVRQREGEILIQVEDNGIGMTPDQVAAALNDDGARADKPHIGLRNVSDRIKLSFGEGYGLHIESQFGEGTRILLTVPMWKSGEGGMT